MENKTKPKEVLLFLTDKSKKIIFSLLFLAVVTVDQIVLKNAIFPAGELLESNVFRAVMITLIAILTKDVQKIFQQWVDNKVQ